MKKNYKSSSSGALRSKGELITEIKLVGRALKSWINVISDYSLFQDTRQDGSPVITWNCRPVRPAYKWVQ